MRALRSGPFLIMMFKPALRIARLRAAVGIATLVFGAMASGTPPPAAADGLSTSAEYIVAFSRYVQWQDEDQLSVWSVCYVGEMPRDQEQLYIDSSVRNKPFAVRNIKADAAFSTCQIIDLTGASTETAKRILAKSRRMPILTVGSGSEFCSIGGQICLSKNSEDTKSAQKFGLNLSNIKESKLNVSARLLTIGLVRNTNEDDK